ncbi:wall-associated receptor kinase-like 15 [Quercus suber]|uniref:Wall-associated receptor kinase-like 15 n=1 Tax=Quercus suber TaxID=58331 RepID=A0AAW0K4T6_QUESU
MLDLEAGIKSYLFEFILYLKLDISAEPTVRNCEPCGTNMIPYPLSASSNCGDPMYFSFNCNTTSGQVSFNAPNDVEIVWEPPLEPICNLSTDCKDWPHSTCKSASDGKRRCLCTKSFRWDGTKLSCTQGYVGVLIFLITYALAWRLWTDDKLLDLTDETLRDTCIADQFVKCLNIGF